MSYITRNELFNEKSVLYPIMNIGNTLVNLIQNFDEVRFQNVFITFMKIKRRERNIVICDIYKETLVLQLKLKYLFRDYVFQTQCNN